MDIGWIIALLGTYPIAGAVGATLLVLGVLHLADRSSGSCRGWPGQGEGSGVFFGIEFGGGGSGSCGGGGDAGSD